ncbi:MAG: Rid family detoxifying hydrolase [Armatimonadota bacterium]
MPPSHKHIVTSPKLPTARGPYSPAIRVGNMLFVSGYGPIDPETDEVVKGDFATQVRLTLDNVKTLLEEAGGALDDVVKTTVYLSDMDNFPALNEIYATYFVSDPPARTTIQAARLPLDIDVEIDCIAHLRTTE